MKKPNTGPPTGAPPNASPTPTTRIASGIASTYAGPTRPRGHAGRGGAFVGASFGPYVAGRLLGEGAFGEVYVARDQRTEREVALKVLKFDGTGAGVRPELARFSLEAHLATNLPRHPNLARGVEADLEASPAWMAFELLDGETLAARLRRGSFTPEETVAVGLMLAAALDTVAEAGFVHCDVKPANVMLVRELSGSTRAVLIDYNAALPTNATAAGIKKLGVCFTYKYAAPELLAAAYNAQAGMFSIKVDPRADQFSLAVVLAECLGLTVDDLRHPTTEVGHILARMCANMSEKRFDSAGEALRALAAAT